MRHQRISKWNLWKIVAAFVYLVASLAAGLRRQQDEVRTLQPESPKGKPESLSWALLSVLAGALISL
jgi:hypothetical protein